MLIPLLDAHPDRLTGDKRLLADKAYSHNSTRADLRKRKIKHTIPERSNQISYRKSKGSAGGRPPPSTPRPTATATPANAASTGSNSGAASPPATTVMMNGCRPGPWSDPRYDWPSVPCI